MRGVVRALGLVGCLLASDSCGLEALASFDVGKKNYDIDDKNISVVKRNEDIHVSYPTGFWEEYILNENNKKISFPVPFFPSFSEKQGEVGKPMGTYFFGDNDGDFEVKYSHPHIEGSLIELGDKFKEMDIDSVWCNVDQDAIIKELKRTGLANILALMYWRDSNSFSLGENSVSYGEIRNNGKRYLRVEWKVKISYGNFSCDEK